MYLKVSFEKCVSENLIILDVTICAIRRRCQEGPALGGRLAKARRNRGARYATW